MAATTLPRRVRGTGVMRLARAAFAGYAARLAMHAARLQPGFTDQICPNGLRIPDKARRSTIVSGIGYCRIRPCKSNSVLFHTLPAARNSQKNDSGQYFGPNFPPDLGSRRRPGDCEQVERTMNWSVWNAHRAQAVRFARGGWAVGVFAAVGIVRPLDCGKAFNASGSCAWACSVVHERSFPPRCRMVI